MGLNLATCFNMVKATNLNIFDFSFLKFVCTCSYAIIANLMTTP